MDTNDKFIQDEKEFWALMPNIRKFTRLHNTLKSDFVTLLQITELYKTDTSDLQDLE